MVVSGYLGGRVGIPWWACWDTMIDGYPGYPCARTLTLYTTAVAENEYLRSVSGKPADIALFSYFRFLLSMLTHTTTGHATTTLKKTTRRS